MVLDQGEGHFIYLNSCDSTASANSVPLCRDRESVDREAVHGKIADSIIAFLHEALTST